MSEEKGDYTHSINLAIVNAKKRMAVLDNLDRKCISDEYKEWINDGFNEQSILLLREDPII